MGLDTMVCFVAQQVVISKPLSPYSFTFCRNYFSFNLIFKFIFLNERLYLFKYFANILKK